MKSTKQLLFERMHTIGGMPINENTINEVDWENDFKDVEKQCILPNDLAEYLNSVRANAPLKTAEREKFKKKYPFIHAKSTFFDKETLNVNVDEFINRMTQPPNFVVGVNDKLLKSGQDNEFVVKTGVPAFRGLVYDKANDKFYFVNTCPGAGQCVFICYALKGNFIMYSGAYDNMTRVLNCLLNEPEDYKQQLYSELIATAKKHKAFGDSPNVLIIRWNDSGDFFSKKYVSIATEVMNKIKNEGYHVQDYAYTKMADVANDEELFGSVKFSAGGDTRQAKNVSTTQRSIIVPSELFNDLNIKDPDDLTTLKDRVVADQKIQSQSNVPIKRQSVLTYMELMNKPVENTPRWSVIVTPNDGDDAGIRKDVQNVLLTIH